MEHTDPHDLQRYLDAQRPAYARVQAELRSGAKSSHWMWFFFPQWHGLGHSSMARRYAIGSLDEALAYARHPVLGERLQHCTRLAVDCDAVSARALFGHPDDLKFQSCMTLFSQAAPALRVFDVALNRFFQGARDRRTLALMAESGHARDQSTDETLPGKPDGGARPA